MSVFAESLEPVLSPRTEADYYLVNHGRNGLLGSFEVERPLMLARGDQVVVQTVRGLESGTVLGPAGVRLSRLLGATPSGRLLRILNDDDRRTLMELRDREQELFHAGRRWAQSLDLPLEIVDAELLLDGRHGWLNFIGPEPVDVRELQDRLVAESGVQVHLEPVAVALSDHESDHLHGCGKPDCGKTLGGCSSCGNGSGGCSTCGGTKVDLRPYFANLREAMEVRARVPLN